MQAYIHRKKIRAFSFRRRAMWLALLLMLLVPNPAGAVRAFSPQTGKVDARLMPDAAITLQEPGLTAYETKSPMLDVLAFYQKQLSAAGWKADNAPGKSEKMDAVRFSRDKLELLVAVTSTDAGTTVWLILNNALAPVTP